MSISVSLCLSNLKCYPWLETDASAAERLVVLYAQLTDTLHHKFRGWYPAVLSSHEWVFKCCYSLLSLLLNLLLLCVYVSDRLLPGQRGALWLCMMQYCESCTSPRTPEYLLYLYHTHLRSLPWRHLHPDTQLMEQLFNVRHSTLRLPTPMTPQHCTLA